MKILFIAKGNLPDFQSDMTFLGGRELFGADFVDANRNWYSYKEDKQKFWKERVPNGGDSYGRGFTLHGILDDIPVDRTDIEAKIASRFYDFVIYGSVSRCNDYLKLVIETYPKERVIFIDGEDDNYIRTQLTQHGRYFKRELLDFSYGGVNPINFSIPRRLIVDDVPAKTKMFAHIIPGDLSTYIYGMDDEVKYHQDYRDSYFAVTMKKAGWDCLRHYEILADGCVPYFLELEKCPASMMVPFPKERLIEIHNLLANEEYEIERYAEDSAYLLDYTKKFLTCETMVEKLLTI
jgi:hypothetical protein